MSLRAHILIALSAALPLLAVSAWAWTRTGDAAVLWAAVLGLAAIAATATTLWRGSGLHLRRLLSDLDAEDGVQGRVHLSRLRQDLSGCAVQRDDAMILLDDVSNGLGEGLLVVSSDLRIRLINPVSLRFCGRERISPGTLLLELMRDPDLVRAVSEAAEGGHPDPVVVENERGLWEVRAFPLAGGGAVVLLADVGLIRRSEELRRQFVQDLSHELRSPLAVIRTTVEALESEIEPQGAQILVRQVERLTRLTGELQELISIEAGEVHLDPEPLHLRSLVEEVAEDLRSPAEVAAVELRLEVPKGLLVTADRRALGRVLTNLVDNAIKCNRRGGWVEVRAIGEERAVVIEVEDNGVGIPADQVRAVFQRFYRIDSARTPGQGGLGLGLAIVKHLVQRMGGRVSIASRETVGTTVTLRLG